jgi:hypothetical protein
LPRGLRHFFPRNAQYLSYSEISKHKECAEWTCSKSISSEEKVQEEHTKKLFEVSELTKLRRGSISIMQMRPKGTGLARGRVEGLKKRQSSGGGAQLPLDRHWEERSGPLNLRPGT